MTVTQIDPKTAMTLAAIAATGATPRPSGETLQEQTDRITFGVTQQLAKNASGWELSWLALSPDNANMAYVAVNLGANQVAVVTRGTVANLSDILEDFDVGTVVPFTAGGAQTPISVSKGALDAFTQVMGMTGAFAGSTGVNLNGALSSILSATMGPNPVVFAIGHSLGGCLATMVGLSLQAGSWAQNPSFGVVAFAAPTAGLGDFASYFDSRTWAQCQLHVNHYDVIPQAWSNLPPADWPWYQDPPGPVATDEVDLLVGALSTATGYHTYVQPSAIKQYNQDYHLRDDNLVANSTMDFLGQIAFQHANSTYLDLLGAGDVKLYPAPMVIEVRPGFGLPRSEVTIIGKGFTAVDPEHPTMVDFGPVPCETFEVKSDEEIFVYEVPAGSGIADVQVTTPFGTSAASQLAKYAYGGPAPVRVFRVEALDTDVQPPQVMVWGTGFGAGARVFFGKVPSPQVQLVDPLQLRVMVPPGDPGTVVNVTVLYNGYSSPTSPVDQYTYPS